MMDTQLNIRPLQNPTLECMSWTGVISLMIANRALVHPSQDVWYCAKLCMARMKINVTKVPLLLRASTPST